MFCLVVCICTVCTPSARRSQEGSRSPGTEVMDGCGAPCGCWESNPDPLPAAKTAFTCTTISLAEKFSDTPKL